MQIQHGWFKSVITYSVFHNMDGNKACPSYQLWSWNSTDSFLFGPTGLCLCPRENTPTANSRKDKKLQPANAIGEEGTIMFTSIFFSLSVGTTWLSCVFVAFYPQVLFTGFNCMHFSFTWSVDNLRMGSCLPLESVARGYKESLHIKKAQNYDIYLYILNFC